MSLTFITTCAHCPQKFTTPGFGDLLGTESGRVKIGNVFQALIGHLQKRHRILNAPTPCISSRFAICTNPAVV